VYECLCRVQIGGPPLARAYRPRDEVVPSNFRRFYDRGDLPIAIEHAPVCNKVAWKVDCSPLLL